MSLCFLTSNWLFHSSNFLSIFFFSKCSHGTTAEATLNKFRCLNTKHFKLERPYLRRKQMIFWVNPRQCSFLQNELYIFCRYTYRHTNVALKKPQTKQEIIIKVISHSKFFSESLLQGKSSLLSTSGKGNKFLLWTHYSRRGLAADSLFLGLCWEIPGLKSRKRKKYLSTDTALSRYNS